MQSRTNPELDLRCPAPFVLDRNLGTCVEPAPDGFVYSNGVFVRKCPEGMVLNSDNVCIRPVLSRASFVNENTLKNTVMMVGMQSTRGSGGGLVQLSYDEAAKDMLFKELVPTVGPVNDLLSLNGDLFLGTRNVQLLAPSKSSLSDETAQQPVFLAMSNVKRPTVKNASILTDIGERPEVAADKMALLPDSTAGSILYMTSTPADAIYAARFSASDSIENDRANLTFKSVAYNTANDGDPFFVGALGSLVKANDNNVVTNTTGTVTEGFTDNGVPDGLGPIVAQFVNVTDTVTRGQIPAGTTGFVVSGQIGQTLSIQASKGPGNPVAPRTIDASFGTAAGASCKIARIDVQLATANVNTNSVDTDTLYLLCNDVAGSTTDNVMSFVSEKHLYSANSVFNGLQVQPLDNIVVKKATVITDIKGLSVSALAVDSLSNTVALGILGEAPNVNSVTASTYVKTFTGADQVLPAIPVGTLAIKVQMWGAGGSGSSSAVGGSGAYVEGFLKKSTWAVGTIITTIVGSGTGGYGGGGLPNRLGAGAGGGRSALRIGTTEVVTVGGGGGSVGSARGGSASATSTAAESGQPELNGGVGATSVKAGRGGRFYGDAAFTKAFSGREFKGADSHFVGQGVGGGAGGGGRMGGGSGAFLGYTGHEDDVAAGGGGGSSFLDNVEVTFAGFKQIVGVASGAPAHGRVVVTVYTTVGAPVAPFTPESNRLLVSKPDAFKDLTTVEGLKRWDGQWLSAFEDLTMPAGSRVAAVYCDAENVVAVLASVTIQAPLWSPDGGSRVYWSKRTLQSWGALKQVNGFDKVPVLQNVRSIRKFSSGASALPELVFIGDGARLARMQDTQSWDVRDVVNDNVSIDSQVTLIDGQYNGNASSFQMFGVPKSLDVTPQLRTKFSPMFASFYSTTDLPAASDALRPLGQTIPENAALPNSVSHGWKPRTILASSGSVIVAVGGPLADPNKANLEAFDGSAWAMDFVLNGDLSYAWKAVDKADSSQSFETMDRRANAIVSMCGPFSLSAAEPADPTSSGGTLLSAFNKDLQTAFADFIGKTLTLPTSFYALTLAGPMTLTSYVAVGAPVPFTNDSAPVVPFTGTASSSCLMVWPDNPFAILFSPSSTVVSPIQLTTAFLTLPMPPTFAVRSCANLLVSTDDGSSYQLGLSAYAGLPLAVSRYAQTALDIWHTSAAIVITPSSMGTDLFRAIAQFNDTRFLTLGNAGLFVAVGNFVWDLNTLFVHKFKPTIQDLTGCMWVSMDGITWAVVYMSKVTALSGSEKTFTDQFWLVQRSEQIGSLLVVLTDVGMYTTPIKDLATAAVAALAQPSTAFYVVMQPVAANPPFGATCTERTDQGVCFSCTDVSAYEEELSVSSNKVTVPVQVCLGKPQTNLASSAYSRADASSDASSINNFSTQSFYDASANNDSVFICPANVNRDQTPAAKSSAGDDVFSCSLNPCPGGLLFKTNVIVGGVSEERTLCAVTGPGYPKCPTFLGVGGSSADGPTVGDETLYGPVDATIVARLRQKGTSGQNASLSKPGRPVDPNGGGLYALGPLEFPFDGQTSDKKIVLGRDPQVFSPGTGPLWSLSPNQFNQPNTKTDTPWPANPLPREGYGYYTASNAFVGYGQMDLDTIAVWDPDFPERLFEKVPADAEEMDSSVLSVPLRNEAQTGILRPTSVTDNINVAVANNFFRPRNWAFTGLLQILTPTLSVKQQVLSSDQPAPDGSYEFLKPDPWRHASAQTSFPLNGDMVVGSKAFDFYTAAGTAIVDLNGQALTWMGQTPDVNTAYIAGFQSFDPNVYSAFHYWTPKSATGTYVSGATLDIFVNATKLLSIADWTSGESTSFTFEPLDQFVWSDPVNGVSRSLRELRQEGFLITLVQELEPPSYFTSSSRYRRKTMLVDLDLKFKGIEASLQTTVTRTMQVSEPIALLRWRFDVSLPQSATASDVFKSPGLDVLNSYSTDTAINVSKSDFDVELNQVWTGLPGSPSKSEPQDLLGRDGPLADDQKTGYGVNIDALSGGRISFIRSWIDGRKRFPGVDATPHFHKLEYLHAYGATPVVNQGIMVPMPEAEPQGQITVNPLAPRDCATFRTDQFLQWAGRGSGSGDVIIRYAALPGALSFGGADGYKGVVQSSMALVDDGAATAFNVNSGGAPILSSANGYSDVAGTEPYKSALDSGSIVVVAGEILLNLTNLLQQEKVFIEINTGYKVEVSPGVPSNERFAFYQVPNFALEVKNRAYPNETGTILMTMQQVAEQFQFYFDNLNNRYNNISGSCQYLDDRFVFKFNYLLFFNSDFRYVRILDPVGVFAAFMGVPEYQDNRNGINTSTTYVFTGNPVRLAYPLLTSQVNWLATGVAVARKAPVLQPVSLTLQVGLGASAPRGILSDTKFLSQVGSPQSTSMMPALKAVVLPTQLPWPGKLTLLPGSRLFDMTNGLTNALVLEPGPSELMLGSLERPLTFTFSANDLASATAVMLVSQSCFVNLQKVFSGAHQYAVYVYSLSDLVLASSSTNLENSLWTSGTVDLTQVLPKTFMVASANLVTTVQEQDIGRSVLVDVPTGTTKVVVVALAGVPVSASDLNSIIVSPDTSLPTLKVVLTLKADGALSTWLNVQQLPTATGPIPAKLYTSLSMSNGQVVPNAKLAIDIRPVFPAQSKMPGLTGLKKHHFSSVKRHQGSQHVVEYQVDKPFVPIAPQQRVPDYDGIVGTKTFATLCDYWRNSMRMKQDGKQCDPTDKDCVFVPPDDTLWKSGGKVWNPFTGGVSVSTTAFGEPTFASQNWVPSYRWSVSSSDGSNTLPSSVTTSPELLAKGFAVFTCTDGSMRKFSLSGNVVDVTSAASFVLPSGSQQFPGALYNLLYFKGDWWCTAQNGGIWTTYSANASFNDPFVKSEFLAGAIKFNTYEEQPTAWASALLKDSDPNPFVMFQVVTDVEGSKIVAVKTNGETIIVQPSLTRSVSVTATGKPVEVRRYKFKASQLLSTVSRAVTGVATANGRTAVGLLRIAQLTQGQQLQGKDLGTVVSAAKINETTDADILSAPTNIAYNAKLGLGAVDVSEAMAQFVSEMSEGLTSRLQSIRYTEFTQFVNQDKVYVPLYPPNSADRTAANFSNDNVQVTYALANTSTNDQAFGTATLAVQVASSLVTDQVFSQGGIAMDTLAQHFFQIQNVPLSVFSSVALSATGSLFHNLQTSGQWSSVTGTGLAPGKWVNSVGLNISVNQNAGPVKAHFNRSSSAPLTGLFLSAYLYKACPNLTDLTISALVTGPEANAVAFSRYGPYSDERMFVTDVVGADGSIGILPVPSDYTGPDMSGAVVMQWNPYELRFYASGVGRNIADAASVSVRGKTYTASSRLRATSEKRLLLVTYDCSNGVRAGATMKNWKRVAYTTSTATLDTLDNQFTAINALAFSPSITAVGGHKVSSTGLKTVLMWRTKVPVGSNDIERSWTRADLVVAGTITAMHCLGFAWYIFVWNDETQLSSAYFASTNFSVVALVDSFRGPTGSNVTFKAVVATSGVQPMDGSSCKDGFVTDPQNPSMCIKNCPTGFKPFGNVCVQTCPSPFTETGVANECKPDTKTARTTLPIGRDQTVPGMPKAIGTPLAGQNALAGALRPTATIAAGGLIVFAIIMALLLIFTRGTRPRLLQ